MKRRLLQTSMFIVVVAAALWLVGRGLATATRYLDYSEPKLQESLAFENQRFDVLFLGNSLTLSGVSPAFVDQQLGITSYNFAAGGASLLQSELQLRHHLAHNQPPRVVAVGLYLDADRQFRGITPTVYYALSSELRRLYWSKSGEPYDKSFVLFNLVDAYRYRATLDLLIKWLVTRQDTRPRFLLGQAQVEFSRPVTQGPPHRVAYPVEELRSLLAFCRERSLPVLVFEPPASPGSDDNTRNRGEILREVTAVVNEFPTARFVSFSASTPSFPSTEWINLDHLNRRGADKFSAMLARELTELLGRP